MLRVEIDFEAEVGDEIQELLTSQTVMLLVTDVLLDIGLHGIPLLPALACYGNGLIMQMGFSLQLAVVLHVISFVYVTLATILCIDNGRSCYAETSLNSKMCVSR
ncbi:hypothetical protein PRIPAC_96794 [Pristionchus pacificus]|uniref:Uncharacterized protein n=1 Tax=Pristionchus pacificus TaxID=54126 RepID=A0A2A6B2W6_PRIPA|nr:hypothetical protein PRIPAC_96794 [Pristionchus pacificus]|eukprot:PDM60212.1 hypothetical protein PRIPAC_54037 [Pristionchus pacificus]